MIFLRLQKCQNITRKVQNDLETNDFGLAERRWQGTANAYITEREPNAHGPRRLRLFISNWTGFVRQVQTQFGAVSLSQAGAS
jgi:hypothetical protein